MTFIEEISNILAIAYETAGFDSKFAAVSVSNRPDLCEFSSNGAMMCAKTYKRPPMEIAKAIADKLSEQSAIEKFEKIEIAPPGFINMTLAKDFVVDYINQTFDKKHYGLIVSEPKKIMVDYGGPNVAKPLHVGHLRSAVIGESIKRIIAFFGHEVIGDIHLGDWGLQMGLIIAALFMENPDLIYFDAAYEGEYPKTPPFTIDELEEIYPKASAKSKTDEAFKNLAQEATRLLQNGHRGYTALWRHILKISKADLMKNYNRLNVSFELWMGESDVFPLIPEMVTRLMTGGYAIRSEGALVVEISEESDTLEIPPCIILKSDGASLYSTTDLATIIWRTKNIAPDEIIYLTDKRQSMHFIQVFRTAKKCGLAPFNMSFRHIGFGTMNGKDGKPFKTRDGGVMRLGDMIELINAEMQKKIIENGLIEEGQVQEVSEMIALAALKYGDLSNQAAKDYILDLDRFMSFEGDTGPYILYTLVRIKSILAKFGKDVSGFCFNVTENAEEKALMLTLAALPQALIGSYEELAPHKLCAYLYDLANTFNKFYHSTKILTEVEELKKQGYLKLCAVTLRAGEDITGLLGFSVPDKM